MLGLPRTVSLLSPQSTCPYPLDGLTVLRTFKKETSTMAWGFVKPLREDDVIKLKKTYVHVCGCAWAHSVHIYAFACRGQRLSWGFFISYSLSCFWLGSLTGFGEAGPGDPRDVPASVQLQAHTIASSFLNVCWRTKLKTSCLCRQHFTDWAFPNPRI